MCVMERDHQAQANELHKYRNEVRMMAEQLKMLHLQVDLSAAIRAAIPTLDDDDYAWLKVQMYRYKIDKSVVLKTTHGRLAGGKRLKRGEALPVNGFMAIPRQGDPEAHLATSIGGLAIAGYLDEALGAHGSAQAMGLMLKAWWRALPGADA